MTKYPTARLERLVLYTLFWPMYSDICITNIDDLIRTAIISKNIIEFRYHNHHTIAESHVLRYMGLQKTILGSPDKRPELF